MIATSGLTSNVTFLLPFVGVVCSLGGLCSPTGEPGSLVAITSPFGFGFLMALLLALGERPRGTALVLGLGTSLIESSSSGSSATGGGGRTSMCCERSVMYLKLVATSSDSSMFLRCASRISASPLIGMPSVFDEAVDGDSVRATWAGDLDDVLGGDGSRWRCAMMLWRLEGTRDAERAECAGAEGRLCLGGGLGAGTKLATRTEAAGPLPLLLLRLDFNRSRGGAEVSSSSSLWTTSLKLAHSRSTSCFNFVSAS